MDTISGCIILSGTVCLNCSIFNEQGSFVMQDETQEIQINIPGLPYHAVYDDQAKRAKRIEPDTPTTE